MTTAQMQPQPGSTVKRIKIRIGDEWVEHSFGRPVPRADAMKRAREILEAFE